MSNRIGVALLVLSSVGLAAPPAAAAPEGAPTLATMAQDLVLELVENGPSELWTFHVSNTGAAPFLVVADPSVLWFEVALPNKSRPVTCRLPEPLWPKSVRRRAVTLLKPGERFSRRFDPRFFCFDDLRQEVLVVGARVTPHFGWPPETKQVRTGGKRTTVTLPPSAPYVAWLPPALHEQDDPDEAATAEESGIPVGAATGSDSTDAESMWREPTEGLKQISGAAIVLSPAYAQWSERPPAASGSLRLVMRAGSDAEDERSATVTVRIENASHRAQRLVLRRELFEYQVTGPDGPFVCGPAELGPPDHGSFATLPSGAAESLTVRIVELCPPRSLSRPGVYEVNAALTSRRSGQPLGLDAFVGRLETPAPALLRIRSGERPSFLRAAPILPSGGVAAATPGAPSMPQPAPEMMEAPGEGSMPADELPPDHEPPAELPPPEAAPPPAMIE